MDEAKRKQREFLYSRSMFSEDPVVNPVEEIVPTSDTEPRVSLFDNLDVSSPEPEVAPPPEPPEVQLEGPEITEAQTFGDVDVGSSMMDGGEDKPLEPQANPLTYNQADGFKAAHKTHFFSSVFGKAFGYDDDLSSKDPMEPSFKGGSEKADDQYWSDHFSEGPEYAMGKMLARVDDPIEQAEAIVDMKAATMSRMYEMAGKLNQSEEVVRANEEYIHDYFDNGWKDYSKDYATQEDLEQQLMENDIDPTEEGAMKKYFPNTEIIEPRLVHTMSPLELVGSSGGAAAKMAWGIGARLVSQRAAGAMVASSIVSVGPQPIIDEIMEDHPIASIPFVIGLGVLESATLGRLIERSATKIITKVDDFLSDLPRGIRQTVIDRRKAKFMDDLKKGNMYNKDVRDELKIEMNNASKSGSLTPEQATQYKQIAGKIDQADSYYSTDTVGVLGGELVGSSSALSREVPKIEQAIVSWYKEGGGFEEAVDDTYIGLAAEWRSTYGKNPDRETITKLKDFSKKSVEDFYLNEARQDLQGVGPWSRESVLSGVDFSPRLKDFIRGSDRDTMYDESPFITASTGMVNIRRIEADPAMDEALQRTMSKDSWASYVKARQGLDLRYQTWSAADNIVINRDGSYVYHGPRKAPTPSTLNSKNKPTLFLPEDVHNIPTVKAKVSALLAESGKGIDKGSPLARRRVPRTTTGRDGEVIEYTGLADVDLLRVARLAGFSDADVPAYSKNYKDLEAENLNAINALPVAERQSMLDQLQSATARMNEMQGDAALGKGLYNQVTDTRLAAPEVGGTKLGSQLTADDMVVLSKEARDTKLAGAVAANREGVAGRISELKLLIQDAGARAGTLPDVAQKIHRDNTRDLEAELQQFEKALSVFAKNSKVEPKGSLADVASGGALTDRETDQLVASNSPASEEAQSLYVQKRENTRVEQDKFINRTGKDMVKEVLKTKEIKKLLKAVPDIKTTKDKINYLSELISSQNEPKPRETTKTFEIDNEELMRNVEAYNLKASTEKGRKALEDPDAMAGPDRIMIMSNKHVVEQAKAVLKARFNPAGKYDAKNAPTLDRGWQAMLETYNKLTDELTRLTGTRYERDAKNLLLAFKDRISGTNSLESVSVLTRSQVLRDAQNAALETQLGTLTDAELVGRNEEIIKTMIAELDTLDLDPAMRAQTLFNAMASLRRMKANLTSAKQMAVLEERTKSAVILAKADGISGTEITRMANDAKAKAALDAFDEEIQQSKLDTEHDAELTRIVEILDPEAHDQFLMGAEPSGEFGKGYSIERSLSMDDYDPANPFVEYNPQDMLIIDDTNLPLSIAIQKSIIKISDTMQGNPGGTPWDKGFNLLEVNTPRDVRDTLANFPVKQLPGEIANIERKAMVSQIGFPIHHSVDDDTAQKAFGVMKVGFRQLDNIAGMINQNSVMSDNIINMIAFKKGMNYMQAYVDILRIGDVSSDTIRGMASYTTRSFDALGMYDSITYLANKNYNSLVDSSKQLLADDVLTAKMYGELKDFDAKLRFLSGEVKTQKLVDRAIYGKPRESAEATLLKKFIKECP